MTAKWKKRSGPAPRVADPRNENAFRIDRKAFLFSGRSNGAKPEGAFSAYAKARLRLFRNPSMLGLLRRRQRFFELIVSAACRPTHVRIARRAGLRSVLDICANSSMAACSRASNSCSSVVRSRIVSSSRGRSTRDNRLTVGRRGSSVGRFIRNVGVGLVELGFRSIPQQRMTAAPCDGTPLRSLRLDSRRRLLLGNLRALVHRLDSSSPESRSSGCPPRNAVRASSRSSSSMLTRLRGSSTWLAVCTRRLASSTRSVLRFLERLSNGQSFRFSAGQRFRDKTFPFTGGQRRGTARFRLAVRGRCFPMTVESLWRTPALVRNPPRRGERSSAATHRAVEDRPRGRRSGVGRCARGTFPGRSVPRRYHPAREARPAPCPRTEGDRHPPACIEVVANRAPCENPFVCRGQTQRTRAPSSSGSCGPFQESRG